VTDRAAPTADELLEHADWLHRLARALVGDANADDIVQETFAAAVTKPPAEAGALRPWLGGVARNLAKMSLRGRKRRTAHEDRAAIEAPTDVPSSEELVERARMQQKVAALVMELPDVLRDVLLLRFFEGMSAADIARAQNIPGATVRSRLSDALARVREELDAQHGGDRRRWERVLAPIPFMAGAAARTALVTGGLVKAKVVLGVVVVALIALVASWRLGWIFGGGTPTTEVPAVATTAPPKGPAPESQAPQPLPAASASTASHKLRYDYEPEGSLQLEGQVIDEHDKPVENATVVIDTMFPRHEDSGADGAFAFGRLTPHTYEVSAGIDDLYAGPVRIRLTDKSEPVTLRLRKGSPGEVTLVDAASGKPIPKGTVELRSSTKLFGATADDKGVATFKGLPPMWAPLVARAPGYAENAIMVSTAGDPAVPLKATVALTKGALLTGTIVDENGKPVVAQLVAELASQPFPVADLRADTLESKPDGTFSVGPLSAGTWRITAYNTTLAPATTAPIVVDGVHAKTGVKIVMTPGALLKGTVTDATGKPIAGAEVKIVGRGNTVWRSTRLAVSDTSGAFQFAGLARRAVDVVATHETGASKIVPVDLAAKAEQTVAIKLDLVGAISGTVSDDHGQPIGDAQVVVDPVFDGGITDREAWIVRGPQTAVTDQGGAFNVAGLPEGDYQVRAARPAATDAELELAQSVKARVTTLPGAPIKLILESNGSIKGKVAMADGSVPASFTISIGGTSPVPFATPDGSFSLPAVAGIRTIVVDGRRFLAAKSKMITVEAGKVADAGTITVQPGRSVRGRVLDETGAPVRGAKVAAGSLLTGGGAELYIEDESLGAKATDTDDRGEFVIEGFSPGPLTITAGKDGVGRSPSVRLAPSSDSATVDLVLQRTAGLDGTVTQNGKGLADTVVIASPIGTQQNFFVVTGADGTFALDALTPGAYIIFPMIGGGGPKPKDMFVTRVDIALAAARTKITIDTTPGPLSLTLAVNGADGKPVAGAMVFAISADIPAPTTSAQLRDMDQLGIFTSTPTPIYIRAAMGGPVDLAGLRAGPLVLCATDLPSRGPGGDANTDNAPIACTKLVASASASTKQAAVTMPSPAK
jgi:RNA polymerase sigma-70 factor (ECF subfamily)